MSYFLLKGKCRYCGKKIPIKYPIVEFITALLLVLIYFKFGLEKLYFFYIIIIGFMIVFSVIDIERQIIIDKVLLLFILLAIILTLLGISKTDIFENILGFLIGGVIIFLLNFFSNGKIGEGDIKLLAALGMWLGAYEIVNIIFYSFIVGGIISVLLIIFKIKNKSDKIAFIPFILLGFILRLFTS